MIDWLFTPSMPYHAVIAGIAIAVALAIRAASVARKLKNTLLAIILYAFAAHGAIYALQTYWSKFPPISPFGFVTMLLALMVLWTLGIERYVDTKPDYNIHDKNSKAKTETPLIVNKTINGANRPQHKA
jgi:hypothetical protein